MKLCVGGELITTRRMNMIQVSTEKPAEELEALGCVEYNVVQLENHSFPYGKICKEVGFGICKIELAHA